MDISDSVCELLARGSKDLKFYETFLSSYPQFRDFFRTTNMQRQSNLLISSMVMIESHHAVKNEGFAAYLRHLGTDHEKRGISTQDYTNWTEAMLAALEDFHGASWSHELKNSWDAAIEHAVADILSGYSST